MPDAERRARARARRLRGGDLDRRPLAARPDRRPGRAAGGASPDRRGCLRRCRPHGRARQPDRRRLHRARRRGSVPAGGRHLRGAARPELHPRHGDADQARVLGDRRAVRRVARLRGLGHVAANRAPLRVRLHARDPRPLPGAPEVAQPAASRSALVVDRNVDLPEARRAQPRLGCGPVRPDRAGRLPTGPSGAARVREGQPPGRPEPAGARPLRAVSRGAAVPARGTAQARRSRGSARATPAGPAARRPRRRCSRPPPRSPPPGCRRRGCAPARRGARRTPTRPRRWRRSRPRG